MKIALRWIHVYRHFHKHVVSDDSHFGFRLGVESGVDCLLPLLSSAGYSSSRALALNSDPREGLSSKKGTENGTV